MKPKHHGLHRALDKAIVFDIIHNLSPAWQLAFGELRGENGGEPDMKSMSQTIDTMPAVHMIWTNSRG